jgi:hypothetical protein
MALKINKPTGYGVDATYFKVYELHLNFHDSVGRVVLAGWATKAARDENKSPLLIVHAQFGIDPNGPETLGREVLPIKGHYSVFPFTIEGKNTKEAYTFLKSLPEWADAEDE